MITVPRTLPVTMPLDEPMLAMVASLLLHVPPVEPSAKVVVEPIHVLSVPVMGSIGLIVTLVVTKQPAAMVYVIVAVPPPTPVTRPEVISAVAFEVLLLLQVPPVIASVSVLAEPAQKTSEPLIAVGRELIVTIVFAAQPVGIV